MIGNAFILALIVYFIKASTWHGHIFEIVDRFARRKLPEKLYKPTIGCSLCMTFWHSWWLYFIAHWTKIRGFEDIRFQTLLFTIFLGCGIAAVLLVFGKIQEDLKKISDDNVKD